MAQHQEKEDPLLGFICLQITNFFVTLLDGELSKSKRKVPRLVQIIPKRKIEDIRDAKGCR
jgi:hypothetical protein